jgi:hypothetical protein
MLSIGNIGAIIPGSIVTVTVTVENTSTFDGKLVATSFDIGYQVGPDGSFLPQTYKTVNIGAGATDKFSFQFTVPGGTEGNIIDIYSWIFPAGNHEGMYLDIDKKSFSVMHGATPIIPSTGETLTSEIAIIKGTPDRKLVVDNQTIVIPGTPDGEFYVSDIPKQIQKSTSFTAVAHLKMNPSPTWSTFEVQLILYAGDKYVDTIGSAAPLGYSGIWVDGGFIPPTTFAVSSISSRISSVMPGAYDLIATLSQEVGLNNNIEEDGRSVHYQIAKVSVGKVTIV